eukprot:GHRR01035334.1.p2 GENE.GHRR01035334.1~~GHRR01035334.1.p2  ORF type:complete len:104 (+),score=33.90 GHRR01035334.1:820-1131(+)
MQTSLCQRKTLCIIPVLLQPFSGAPGYLLGFPLLAGTVESAPSAGTTKQAVSRFTNGLQLPGAGPDGICSGSSSDAVAVGFGYNSTSSCSVAYTLAQVSWRQA